MSTLLADCEVPTLADVLERLGEIPADRVLLRPPPGTATADDLLRLPADVRKNCELVDNTLVRKAMGAPESAMTMAFAAFLARFPTLFKSLVVLGPDGHTRYLSGDIRMPDIAVIRRERLPNGKLPKEAICEFPPDLAVEVLSRGNTRIEIEKKLATFFDSGVRQVWIADPRRRIVSIYRTTEDCRELTDDETLEGGDVLPGFTLSIREWFDSAE